MKITIKQGVSKHTLDLQNVNNVSSELGSCYIAFDNDDFLQLISIEASVNELNVLINSPDRVN